MIDNISVVISSCLNRPEREGYLQRCIENIKETMGDVEILIGFDRYGKEIDGAKCYTHEMGLGHSWNWGIQNASNEFILQMEDDWTIVFKKGHVESLREDIIEKIPILKKFDGIYRFGNLCSDNAPWYNGYLTLNIDGREIYELKRMDSYKHNDFSMYYYSNQPHFKKKDIHSKIGYYKENEPPHAVESHMCENYYMSSKKVFFSPSDSFDFVHIGQARSREWEDR